MAYPTPPKATDRLVSGPSTTPTMTPSIQQPRLTRFISRSNGILVPLIPADELPFSVRLKGVPRAMSLAQTTGMQHAGTEPWTGSCFRLEESWPLRPSSSPPTHNESPAQKQAEQPTKQFLAPDAIVRLGMQQGASASSQQSGQTRPVSAAAASTNWRKPAEKPVGKSVEQTQEAIDAIVASNPVATPSGYATPRSTPPPSGALPDQDKKIYCTHWIRHGECDYIQQGCMYKHEMPDRETLEKIGFRSVPRWWQERTAIRIAGLSSLPTVGAPVKASEWLKRRSSDASDADDESEDESRSASESEDAESAKGTTGNRKTPEIDCADSGPKSQPREVPETPSPPSLRKLSINGDLIGLSPLLPTPSPSSDDSEDPVDKTLRQIAAPARKDAAGGLWASKHAPERHAGSTSPRKVFVPAGESADYHIAQSRRHAERFRSEPVRGTPSNDSLRTESAPSPDKWSPIARHEGKMSGASKPLSTQKQGLVASIHAKPAEVRPQNTSQSPSKPVQILKREVRFDDSASERAGTDKQGSMTSKPAPQFNKPAAAGHDNRPRTPQGNQRPDGDGKGLATSVHASRSTKSDARPVARAQAQRSNTKRDVEKSRCNSDRSERAPRDGCRLRRPAGTKTRMGKTGAGEVGKAAMTDADAKKARTLA